MTQIDTSKWGNFKVGDLFETFHGERLKKSDRIEGSTPFVTAGSENQGVADYIVTEKKYSNAITIDMFGNCFYHDGILFGDDNIYFLISNNISKYSKLFITTIINSTLKEKYSFSHQFRQKDLDTLTINLPSTQDNLPDWQFMEDYMKEITKLAAKRVEKVKEEKPKTKIDTNTWKKFKVGELFECNIAKSLDFGKLEKGNTIFIGRTSTNNGVQGEVNASPCEKGNCITVSMVGDNRAFYQSKEFAASQNILILRNKRLNEKNGLFFAALINSLLAKYNYSNTVKKKEFISETIPLPVTPEGTPDFDYMENYMKNLTKKAKKKLSNIPQ